jgi:hypothetical protein
MKRFSKILTASVFVLAITGAFVTRANTSKLKGPPYHEKLKPNGTCQNAPATCAPALTTACDTNYNYFNDDGSGGCGTAVALFHN